MKKCDNKDKKRKKSLNISFKNNKLIKFIIKEWKIFISKLKFQDNRFNLLELILLMVIAFIFGIFISEALVLENDSKISLNNDSDSLNEVKEVYEKIVNTYYKDIDKEKLNNAAIEGMMSYLSDDYSTYFNKEEANSFNERLDGNYTGIGVEISKNNDDIMISNVFSDSPASKAGIKVNDIIKKINDEDVTNLSIKEIVSKIKGIVNKQISIVVERDGKEININIVTDNVQIDSVYSELMTLGEKKIGYIYISIFALNTSDQFTSTLNNLEDQGIDGLIIDVRNNSGGHLSVVTNILNMFLNKNQILYQVKSKDKIVKTYGITNNTRKYNIVVLTNKYSASASEILASAIKEAYQGKIVGTKTYGKGTVQQTLKLDDGGMIKLTTENWLTSNGNLIDKVGVLPDYEVELSNQYYNNPSKNTDNQLKKALEVVTEKK